MVILHKLISNYYIHFLNGHVHAPRRKKFDPIDWMILGFVQFDRRLVEKKWKDEKLKNDLLVAIDDWRT